jgi:hypothetical protein
MRMTPQPTQLAWNEATNEEMEVPNTDHANVQGNCDVCGTTLYRFRGQGDIVCTNPTCPAIYNSFGQRLRDDLYSRPNPSEYDDDIGDMEGYEEAMCRAEIMGGDF